jgi:hypothetical protein
MTTNRERILAVVAIGLLASVWLVGKYAPEPPSTAAASVRTDVSEQPVITCRDDWRLCSTDYQLEHEWNGSALSRGECEFAAKAEAKFGTPSVRFRLSRTDTGESTFLRSGKAVFVDLDARYPNEFGAMSHAVVVCTYDLDTKEVEKVDISNAN